MRPLGVGAVYWTELAPLFRECVAGLSVVELEPQPYWRRTFASGRAKYVPNATALADIAALPHHKLVHSVTLPFGGLNSFAEEQMEPLRDVVRQMNPAWVSEHLSFNAFEAEDRSVHAAGFLLPPRQTDAGVDVAAANIRRFSSALSVPVAFETGVNYLQARQDEMDDGEFFASIAETADCGILLDLHNLWANERNGRQSVERVLDRLPLDRVWEVHLAGGIMIDGFYIDGHSGAMAPRLLEIAEAVIPRLPKLGAIVFEILPSYVPDLGLNGVREQLSQLEALWRKRPAQSVSVRPHGTRPRRVPGAGDVGAWERSLASLVLGHDLPAGDSLGLASDNGTKVLRKLVDEARNNQIARAARYTLTLMTMHLGPQAVVGLMGDYYARSYPDLFSGTEADGFIRYLKERAERLPRVPYLTEVMNFEHALIRASLYGVSTRIEWEVDPVGLFEALDAGKAPAPARQAAFAMEIAAEAS